MTPQVKTAEYINGYCIRVSFADGKSSQIDLEDELWGEIFEPLRDPEYFKQFFVNAELNTIQWPNGADLAPEFLYETAAPNTYEAPGGQGQKGPAE